ncbi:cation-translocating P-type ATPase [Mesorhizobium retamae]|uniref:Cadmium-translocating P-type ATPase n=1 Tax=Mesorhizobium retamae TaxID=2912854 RepID=A0ABS9QFG3_9HYPH|nr:cation-translocating P-type ATPase [Mesorhizobium sp. IRAMC:0171]MCG7506167.1 cadmium-translocating P-type ATPase [Mesorhizobium sp. IRAMC:0171]
MSCCAPGAESALELDRSGGPSIDEIRLASRSLGGGLVQVDFAVPEVHCAACIRTIETALQKLPGVAGARVNLSTKRVSVRLREGEFPPLVATLSRLGYEAHLFDRENDSGKDPVLSELIRAVAVAGFAATNIMLLSVSVWSGATDATRDLFHWVSALIAIPALAFAGRIYFRSAWNALSRGRMNMDVPIAVGITLAYALSLYETINHGPHAYFDASVSLLFFLLIGRTLDHVMREKARTAVSGLRRLAARGATIVACDGTLSYVPVEEIAKGDVILVAAGERVPVDALVIKGASEVDRSLVSGESELEPVGKGTALQAGTLNLTGALTLEAVAAAKDSFLAEMVRLMEAAEGGRALYRRIADRTSALYAPVVHLTALITFLGWLFASGDWHRAMVIAIAVLIITCPCALGLAVPIVQVVAARRLFEQGVMVKDGSAMERLAGIDTVIFDKTGTLTLGTLRLVNGDRIIPADMAVAAQLAMHSRHPVARAIAEANRDVSMKSQILDAVNEVPGFGLEASMNGSVWRLGRAQWALDDGAEAMGTVLSCDGVLRASFVCEDRLRAGAAETVAELAGQGLVVEMLTGDHDANAKVTAGQAGIDAYRSGMLPGEKVARIAAFADRGRKVLMVGDGLNDAPALAAAHVSMAPATAADIGRNAADFVFLRESLTVIPFALDISRKAGRLIRQNLAFAIAYNFVAVPIAIFGYVTPLVAAIAMSLSSIVVIANAMRLTGDRSVAGKEPRVAPARLIGRPA